MPEAMPWSRLSIIVGTGHVPQAEEPIESARMGGDSVRETEPSTTDRAPLAAQLLPDETTD
jgi:hypothetical protein